ncbi:hypothetical protein [Burkholderia stabilis]|uniref:hypothetical protein n=1 Tax=Burkholderia stabilis TaxID=95485 RepID=UPI0016462C82|nr:hypothetical protein [Burkholderia stabilis]
MDEFLVDIVDPKQLETLCIRPVSVIERCVDVRFITWVVDIATANNPKRCAHQR